MTVSQSLLSAIRKEVERRQAMLDASRDIHTVTVTVKFTAGETEVRGVVWQEERLAKPKP